MSAVGQLQSADVQVPQQRLNMDLIEAVESFNIVKAVQLGEYKVFLLIDELLDKGADVNATDASGDTVLHKAARKGSAHLVIRLLEEYNIIINAENTEGQSPLDIAEKTFEESLFLKPVNQLTIKRYNNASAVVRILKEKGAVSAEASRKASVAELFSIIQNL